MMNQKIAMLCVGCLLCVLSHQAWSAPRERFRALKIPAAAPAGPDRQVTVLLDEPHLKLVVIRLRNGALLAEHTTPVPAIIQATSGAGTVSMGGERVHIDAGQLVMLAPGVPHAVTPDPGAELVLLVQHLRGGGVAR